MRARSNKRRTRHQYTVVPIWRTLRCEGMRRYQPICALDIGSLCSAG